MGKTYRNSRDSKASGTFDKRNAIKRTDDDYEYGIEDEFNYFDDGLLDHVYPSGSELDNVEDYVYGHTFKSLKEGT